MKYNIKEYLEKYEIEYNNLPILIGVYGTKGKTTIVNILEQYLRFIGKTVVSFSSLNSDVLAVPPKDGIRKLDERIADTQKEVAKRIKNAITKSPDFIIFEIHEEPSINKIYSEIIFDYRFITQIDEPFNTPAAGYFKESLREFLGDNNGHGLNIVDSFFAPIEWEEWLSENIENTGIVRYYPVVNDIFYEERGRSIPKYRPTTIARGLNKFLFEFLYDNKIHQYDVDQTPFFISYNIFGIIAFLCETKLFKPEMFRLFLMSFNKVPGRGEMYSFNGRNVLIDLNGEEFIKYIKNTPLSNIEERERKLVSEMGYDPETFFMEPTKIKMLTHYQSQFTMHGPTATTDEAKLIERKAMTDSMNDSEADYIILTRTNFGQTDIEASEQYVMTNLTIPFEYNIDRREAIRNALTNLGENELLVITRRGNITENFNEKLMNDAFADVDIVNEWFEENI